MSSKPIRIFFCLVLLATVACSKVPKHVIPPDTMAEIMADLSIAETVVENNYKNFESDSSKMLLKQSIVAKYGYTLADLDTSFMWYGANPVQYDAVLEKSIGIVEKRMQDAGTQAVRQLSVQKGDSLDIWDKTRFIIARPGLASQFLTFDYRDNSKFNKGDIFTIRAKFAGMTSSPDWNISAEYEDGTFEVLSSKFNGDGWHELVFYCDSVRKPTRIFGAVNFGDIKNTATVDSIQFVKHSLDPKYYSRRYRQRAYDLSSKHKPKASPAKPDTDN